MLLATLPHSTHHLQSEYCGGKGFGGSSSVKFYVMRADIDSGIGRFA